MGSLNELAQEVLKTAFKNGFTEATPGEDMALIHSEVSEALEDIRSGRPLTEMRYQRKLKAAIDGLPDHVDIGDDFMREGVVEQVIGKPIGVPSEIADVIIRCLHFCAKHGIDIDKAVTQKMAYNATRPYRHGGKTL